MRSNYYLISQIEVFNILDFLDNLWSLLTSVSTALDLWINEREKTSGKFSF